MIKVYNVGHTHMVDSGLRQFHVWTTYGMLTSSIDNTIEDGFAYSNKFGKVPMNDIIYCNLPPYSSLPPYITDTWRFNEDTFNTFFKPTTFFVKD